MSTYRPKWWDGNGTSDDPYLIKTTADLDQLATLVNSDFSDYSGTYFKLDNDITYNPNLLTIDNNDDGTYDSNYTAIGGDFGGNSRYFSGHFDGGGHTISGIRICQDNKDYQGLFGYIENGEVKNVILADTRITGRVEVGGIAGVNDGFGDVSNCYFTSTTITGKNGNGDDLDNTNSAVGENYATVETNVGLAPQDTKDNSGFLTLMAARNAALTAVERTTPLSTAVDVTLQGRTLYKDGAWNTLCLPFSLTAAQVATVLENPTKLMTLNGTTSDLTNGTLTLNFTDATTISAGVPYIIKWDKATGYDTADPDTRDLKNPVFTGVTIDKTMNDVNTSDRKVTFRGNYDARTFDAENKIILLVGGNNLYWPQTGASIGACRAYFDLSDPNAGVREFRLNFGDGEAAGITTTNYTDLTNYSDAWYTIDGRKFDGKPTKSGLYIHGGKKVVIK